MFEIPLNVILISVMVLAQSQDPVVIRGDRVYRYVGNGSDDPMPAEELASDLQSDESQLSQTGTNSENIPESLLIRLKDIRNASDFIASFLMADQNQQNDKDVYLDYLERGSMSNDSSKRLNINEERRKLTKLPKIGVPAGCIPEKKLVELKPNNSHNEIYFPSCVRISRCSGCCPSRRLLCVPVDTSYEDISVIRVKYSSIEKRLKFEGFKVFRIEKHDKCKCDCIQKASHCSPSQTYSESDCRCLCSNTSVAEECQRDAIKYWDYTQCQCKCKSVPICSTGLVVDNTTCRCRPEPTSPAPPPLRYQSRSYAAQRYGVHKQTDVEIKTQNSKGLHVFKPKGINPDTDEDYRENDDCL